jgi:hypothetical protein
MNISCLIFEHIIVFMNDLFIFRTETESTLTVKSSSRVTRLILHLIYESR